MSHIFIDDYYADRVIERNFKANKKWGSRDRALVAETVYDIVRYWRLYNHLLELDHENYKPHHGPLLMQVYFLLHKGGIPHYEWKKKINRDEIKNKYTSLKDEAILNSFPEWLNERSKNELGENWLKEMQALNEPAPLVLRVNALKSDVANVELNLKSLAIEFSKSTYAQCALVLHRKTNVFSTELFKEGKIEVQDEGSQCIAEFCAPQTGMRVIDACAGAGGKTLHLAALMNNKGKIIAMDISNRKLEELKKRARRAGVFNFETRLIEGSKSIKKLAGSGDVVLLDVPCSGIGVIRRNPDAKWKLSNQFIDEVIQQQKEILNEYCQMTKVGGVLVYSTCSLLPSENEIQVKEFLEENSDFTLEKEVWLTPAKNNTDGFYMAKMKRVS